MVYPILYNQRIISTSMVMVMVMVSTSMLVPGSVILGLRPASVYHMGCGLKQRPRLRKPPPCLRCNTLPVVKTSHGSNNAQLMATVCAVFDVQHPWLDRKKRVQKASSICSP